MLKTSRLSICFKFLLFLRWALRFGKHDRIFSNIFSSLLNAYIILKKYEPVYGYKSVMIIKKGHIISHVSFYRTT